jgi:DNA-binding transcriptional MerR regulator
MLIGELSRLTGFSRDTIRFYEKEGLIKVSRKQRKANNYKDYSDDILKKLLIIKRLKGFGFTLNETSDLLVLIEEDMAFCSTINEKVETKVKTIDEKIGELQQIKNMLLTGVALCLNGCAPSADRNCTLLTGKK